MTAIVQIEINCNCQVGFHVWRCQAAVPLCTATEICWIMWDLVSGSPDTQISCLPSSVTNSWISGPHAWGLNCEWSHMVGPGQLFVLVALIHLSWCCHCPCLPRCQHHMGHRIGVQAGNVPDMSLACLSRSDGHSIRTFTVQPTEIHMLQRRWDLCSSKGHPNHGVDHCMPWKTSCNLVIKAEPQKRLREGIQPGSRLLRLNSQKSSSLPGARCRAQQLLLCHLNAGFIPHSLVLFHWGGRWGLLVSLLPLTANLQNTRGSGILQPIWEDLDQEVLAPSSRCQKGRWGKLGGPTDPQTFFTNWKGSFQWVFVSWCNI